MSVLVHRCIDPALPERPARAGSTHYLQEERMRRIVLPLAVLFTARLRQEAVTIP